MSQKIRVLAILTLLTIGVYFFPEYVKWGDVGLGFVLGALGTSIILLIMKLTKYI